MPETKRLIAIDDETLRAAQAELGTATLKDTVNTALRLAAENREKTLTDRLASLARHDLRERDEAWRSAT